MFTIRGSGFGLYGYLPALVRCGEQVILPERYRQSFQARSELAAFTEAVHWESSDSRALDAATGVAIALRPANQVTLLKECLSRPNIRHLLLEKPLAPSPHLGSTLLKRLIDSRKAFRIGYIFRHTKWGMPLLAALREDRLAGQLTIRWTFLAHHFGQDLASWKRYSDDGGGAIRFYGIHLISLLADCGYSDVVLSQALGPSPNECEKWRAVFAGPHLPRCEVLIDTRSDDRAFHVELDSGAGAKTFAALSDPFDSDPRSASDDRRVSALRKLCRSIRDDRNDYADYEATNDLWGIVEDRTQFVHA